MAELSHRRHRFPPVVIQMLCGSTCASRSAIETSRISWLLFSSTISVQISLAIGPRIEWRAEPLCYLDLLVQFDEFFFWQKPKQSLRGTETAAPVRVDAPVMDTALIERIGEDG